jgi:hypothetical protein
MGDFSVVLFRANFMLVPEGNSMKANKINDFCPHYATPISLVEARTRAHLMWPKVQTPSQQPDMERPLAMWAY